MIINEAINILPYLSTLIVVRFRMEAVQAKTPNTTQVVACNPQ